MLSTKSRKLLHVTAFLRRHSGGGGDSGRRLGVTQPARPEVLRRGEGTLGARLLEGQEAVLDLGELLCARGFAALNLEVLLPLCLGHLEACWGLGFRVSGLGFRSFSFCVSAT